MATTQRQTAEGLLSPEQQNAPAGAVQPDKPFRRAIWRRVAPLAVSLLALGGLSWVWFGSPSNALAYLRGHSVVVEAPVLSAGDIEPGKEATVVFRVRNLTVGQVRVVGAICDCPCACVQELPRAIPPRDVAELAIRFSVRASEAGETVERKALLYLDIDNPSIILKATAHVVAPGNQ